MARLRITCRSCKMGTEVETKLGNLVHGQKCNNCGFTLS